MSDPVTPVNPVMMAVEGQRLLKLQRIAILTEEFLDDVLPQAGKLAIQRYDHLNELCILCREVKIEDLEEIK